MRRMNVEVFVDTNILVYALTHSADPRHEVARQRIRSLWQRAGGAAISVQVLQELQVNLIRKAGLAPATAARLAEPYFAWTVIDNDRSLLRDAWDLQVGQQLSFWDSLIVAAAQRSGASILWSEDPGVARRYGDLIVSNPLLDG
jgi:predicted nucleic acid-binding protein